MTDSIHGLPFWQLRFDAEGDPDGLGAEVLLTEVADRGITDLIVFSHGWNNDVAVARRLYDGFFGQLAPQLVHARPGTKVGLAGVFWPSRRWADEPIPDFEPTPPTLGPGGAAHGAAGGAAARRQPPPEPFGGPELDAATLADLRAQFPAGADELEALAGLLAGPRTAATEREFVDRLAAFAQAAAVPGSHGEDGAADADTPVPPALADDDLDPLDVLHRYDTALAAGGFLAGEGAAGGAAGLGELIGSAWNGGKEALRQLTYWQMKNRAGVVGEHGLGPLLSRLHTAVPGVRVHLVGHSFGGRLVSYALAGLAADTPGAPVHSVTLLQAAFSHVAFAPKLSFRAGAGALAGKQRRIDGPLVVCFSVHDKAVGTFYPLASLLARQDAAAGKSRTYRWDGMGHDGAQETGAVLDAIQPPGPGTTYRLTPGTVLDVDCAAVVFRGSTPSGAHSDIVHPEITWLVLSAAGIVQRSGSGRVA
ncbi:hypothetical protein AGMMS50218_01910 [Actinomycetota bacterium]|nr:hypothetical protein AGMMS50218_01910 [Actinomycetota bacterium]